MPWRVYPTRNYKDCSTGRRYYQCHAKRWIKNGNKPYKPQKRGAEKPSLWSSRFGLLELYNRKEQQGLKCPSGYSLSQCFNVLGKLWAGYHRARRDEQDVKNMEKYAKAIQDVQKDMGIKTTSFPHLGIYGDIFVLNNKQGERVVFEDHSAMKKKQDAYEKWQAQNSKDIQENVQKRNLEEGQEIETFADDVYPYEKVKAEEDELVPHILEADEEAGEELIIMTDDIPFLDNYRNTKKTPLEHS